MRLHGRSLTNTYRNRSAGSSRSSSGSGTRQQICNGGDCDAHTIAGILAEMIGSLGRNSERARRPQESLWRAIDERDDATGDRNDCRLMGL